jgi:hypothetical protein
VCSPLVPHAEQVPSLRIAASPPAAKGQSIGVVISPHGCRINITFRIVNDARRGNLKDSGSQAELGLTVLSGDPRGVNGRRFDGDNLAGQITQAPCMRMLGSDWCQSASLRSLR